MKIGVTVPILNNFHQAVEMLYSIKSKHDVEIKIMDQWRDQKPLAKAWNLGAQHLFDRGCEYVAIVNDDILFGPDCLDNLVTELEKPRDEKIILVSSNNILGQLPDANYILDYHDSFEGSSISDHPNYSLFMIGRKYFEEIGTFDENFMPAWYEDNDSHRRIELLGYRGICTTAASSVHYGGVSTSMSQNKDATRSRDYYIKKWGGIPWPPTHHFDHPYGDKTLSPKDWRQE